MVIMLAPLISRMLMYIFPLLSIVIIFMICLAQYIISVEGFTFWAGYTPRFFTTLTKPIPFLFNHKGFCIVIYLDDILVLVHSKQVGKRAYSFLCFILAHLGLHINFPSLTFASLRLLFLRPMLGYCPYVSIFAS